MTINHQTDVEGVTGFLVPEMRDIEIMARTIWGEARGEIPYGRMAVAWVIRNRAAQGLAWLRSKGAPHPLFGAGSLRDVCFKKYQFSCWNEDDPNRDKLQAVSCQNRAFMECLVAALQVCSEQDARQDPTCGATHYHARQITPIWTRGASVSACIGNHIFYNAVG